jgi:hypothetical protein
MGNRDPAPPVFRAVGKAIAIVVLGALLLLLWGVSTFFFMLEAWGARGMPKSLPFQAWAAFTWCIGPLLLLGVLAGGIVLAIRASGGGGE